VTNYSQDSSGTVSVISGKTNTVIGNPIPVGSGPEGIAFDPANGNLYVVNSGNNPGSVSVISGKTNTVIGSPITIGNLPQFIAFDSANGNMYVTNRADGTVSVISTLSSQTAPDTTITSTVDGNRATVQNAGTTLSTSIQFTFTATPGTKPIAGFECRLDNSAFSACSSPTTLNNLAAGIQHNFQVRAVDTAGNRDPTPATIRWTILTPAQGIQHVIQLKHSMHLNPATDQTLDIRLNVALQLAQNNIKSGTCIQLTVFIKLVQAELRVGQVSSVQATQLIQGAQNIQTGFRLYSSIFWKWNRTIISIAVTTSVITQPNSEPTKTAANNGFISIVVTNSVSISLSIFKPVPLSIPISAITVNTNTTTTSYS
jgi:YVTN family beta-propeller protein